MGNVDFKVVSVSEGDGDCRIEAKSVLKGKEIKTNQILGFTIKGFIDVDPLEQIVIKVGKNLKLTMVCRKKEYNMTDIEIVELFPIVGRIRR